MGSQRSSLSACQGEGVGEAEAVRTDKCCWGGGRKRRRLHQKLQGPHRKAGALLGHSLEQVHSEAPGGRPRQQPRRQQEDRTEPFIKTPL